MSYLVFVLAAGLFAIFGSCGPLHRDQWFDLLARRIMAIDIDSWMATAVVLLFPIFGLIAAHSLLELFIGNSADWLVSIVVLFFSWGRGDYSTELQRLLARVQSGDRAAALILLNCENKPDAEDLDLRKVALTEFGYRGFERWFPVVLYFFLLGPVGSALYRLTHLLREYNQDASQQLLVLLDWLPGRLLLLTFSLLGDFERTRSFLVSSLSNPRTTAEELICGGLDQAWHLQNGDPNDMLMVAATLETTEKAMQRACGVWLIAASLIVLF